MALANNLTVLIRRSVQFLLDPFVVLLPGVGWVAQQCGLCRDSTRYVNPDRLARGLVIVLPGIEGPSLYSSGFRTGLADLPGGPAISVYHWAGFWPGMLAGFSRSHRRRRLAALLDKIRDYRRAYPGRPVVLVGHSGGAAMAIFAAEALGSAERLTGVIAAAAPLHPSYDLSAALAGVRCGLVSCHSRLDYQLQVLVSVGGNFDRRYGATAGRVGFTFDPRPVPAPFTQIAWDRSMIPFGHWGGHVGWGAAAWTRRYLAPIIAEWIVGGGRATMEG